MAGTTGSSNYDIVLKTVIKADFDENDINNLGKTLDDLGGKFKAGFTDGKQKTELQENIDNAMSLFDVETDASGAKFYKFNQAVTQLGTAALPGIIRELQTFGRALTDITTSTKAYKDGERSDAKYATAYRQLVSSGAIAKQISDFGFSSKDLESLLDASIAYTSKAFRQMSLSEKHALSREGWINSLASESALRNKIESIAQQRKLVSLLDNEGHLKDDDYRDLIRASVLSLGSRSGIKEDRAVFAPLYERGKRVYNPNEIFGNKSIQSLYERGGKRDQSLPADTTGDRIIGYSNPLYRGIRRLQAKDQNSFAQQLAIESGLARIEKADPSEMEYDQNKDPGVILRWNNDATIDQMRVFLAKAVAEGRKIRGGKAIFKRDADLNNNISKAFREILDITNLYAEQANDEVSGQYFTDDFIVPAGIELEKLAKDTKFTQGGYTQVQHSVGRIPDYAIPYTTLRRNDDQSITLVPRSQDEMHKVVTRTGQLKVKSKDAGIMIQDSWLTNALGYKPEYSGSYGRGYDENGEPIFFDNSPDIVAMPLEDTWARNEDRYYLTGKDRAKTEIGQMLEETIDNGVVKYGNDGTELVPIYSNGQSMIFANKQKVEAKRNSSYAVGLGDPFSGYDVFAPGGYVKDDYGATNKQLSSRKRMGTQSRLLNDVLPGYDLSGMNYATISLDAQRRINAYYGNQIFGNKLVDGAGFIDPAFSPSSFQVRGLGYNLKGVLGNYDWRDFLRQTVKKTSTSEQSPFMEFGDDDKLSKLLMPNVSFSKLDEKEQDAIIKAIADNTIYDNKNRETLLKENFQDVMASDIAVLLEANMLKGKSQMSYVREDQFENFLVHQMGYTEAQAAAEKKKRLLEKGFLKKLDVGHGEENFIRLKTDELNKNIQASINNDGGLREVKTEDDFSTGKRTIGRQLADAIGFNNKMRERSAELYAELFEKMEDDAYWIEEDKFSSRPDLQQAFEAADDKREFLKTDKAVKYIQGKKKALQKQSLKRYMLDRDSATKLAFPFVGSFFEDAILNAGAEIDPEKDLSVLYGSMLSNKDFLKKRFGFDDKTLKTLEDENGNIDATRMLFSPDAKGAWQIVGRTPSSLNTFMKMLNIGNNKKIRNAFSQLRGGSSDVSMMLADAIDYMNTGDFDGDTVWMYAAQMNLLSKGLEEANKSVQLSDEDNKELDDMIEEQIKALSNKAPKETAGARQLDQIFDYLQGQGEMGKASQIMRNAIDIYNASGKSKEDKEAFAKAYQLGSKYYDKATSEGQNMGWQGDYQTGILFDVFRAGRSFDRFQKVVSDAYNTPDEDLDEDIPSIFSHRFKSLNNILAVADSVSEAKMRKARGGLDFGFGDMVDDLIERQYGTYSGHYNDVLFKYAQKYADFMKGQEDLSYLASDTEIEDFFKNAEQEINAEIGKLDENNPEQAEQKKYLEKELKALLSAKDKTPADRMTKENLRRHFMQADKGSAIEKTLADAMTLYASGQISSSKQIADTEREIDHQEAIKAQREKLKVVKKAVKATYEGDVAGFVNFWTDYFKPINPTTTQIEDYIKNPVSLPIKEITYDKNGEHTKAGAIESDFNGKPLFWDVENQNRNLANDMRKAMGLPEENEVHTPFGSFVHDVFRNLILEKDKDRIDSNGQHASYSAGEFRKKAKEIWDTGTIKIGNENVSWKDYLTGASSAVNIVDPLTEDEWNKISEWLGSTDPSSELKLQGAAKQKLVDKINKAFALNENKNDMFLQSIFGKGKLFESENQIYDPEKGFIIPYGDHSDMSVQDIHGKEGEMTKYRPDLIWEHDNGDLVMYDWKPNEKGGRKSIYQMIKYAREAEEESKKAYDEYRSKIDNDGMTESAAVDSLEDHQKRWLKYRDDKGKFRIKRLVGVDYTGSGSDISFDYQDGDNDHVKLVDLVMDQNLKTARDLWKDKRSGEGLLDGFRMMMKTGIINENDTMPEAWDKYFTNAKTFGDLEKSINQFKARNGGDKFKGNEYVEGHQQEWNYLVAKQSQNREKLDAVTNQIRSIQGKYRTRAITDKEYSSFSSLYEDMSLLDDPELYGALSAVYEDVLPYAMKDIGKFVGDRNEQKKILDTIVSQAAQLDPQRAAQSFQRMMYGSKESDLFSNVERVVSQANQAAGTRQSLKNDFEDFFKTSGTKHEEIWDKAGVLGINAGKYSPDDNSKEAQDAKDAVRNFIENTLKKDYTFTEAQAVDFMNKSRQYAEAQPVIDALRTAEHELISRLFQDDKKQTELDVTKLTGEIRSPEEKAQEIIDKRQKDINNYIASSKIDIGTTDTKIQELANALSNDFGENAKRATVALAQNGNTEQIDNLMQSVKPEDVAVLEQIKLVMEKKKTLEDAVTALNNYLDNGFKEFSTEVKEQTKLQSDQKLSDAVFRGKMSQRQRDFSYEQARRTRWGGSRSRLAQYYYQGETRYQQLETEKLSNEHAAEKLQKEIDAGIYKGADLETANQELENYKKAAADAEAEMGNFTTTQNAAAAAVHTLSESLSMVATRLGRQLFHKALQETKRFVKEFDASMNEIQAITLKSDQEMQSIRSQTINKALGLRTSVSNVSNVEAALYRQGLSDQEVSARTESIIKFATVTKLNVQEATKIITTALQNDLVKSANEAMDALVALGDSAATTAAEIGKGMQKAAAAAKVAGVSYSELTALLTIGTSDTQLSGTQVGTALQTVFTRMRRMSVSGWTADQNGEKTTANDAEAALRTVGVDLWDDKTVGKMRSAYDVLLDLSRVWQNLSDAQKNIVMNSMSGTRQTNVFATLMEGMSEDNGETLEKYLGLAEGSEGVTQSKYEIAMQSLAASMDTLKSSWDAVVESFISGGVISDSLDMFSSILQAVSDSGDISKGLGAIAGGITAIAVAMAALKASHPALAALGAIAGLIAGVGTTGLLGSIFPAEKSMQEKSAASLESTQRAVAANRQMNENKQSVIDDVKKAGEAWEQINNQENEDNLRQSLKSLESAFPNLSTVINQATSDLSGWKNAVDEASKSANKFSADSSLFALKLHQAHAAVYGESDYQQIKDEISPEIENRTQAIEDLKEQENKWYTGTKENPQHDALSFVNLISSTGDTVGKRTALKYLDFLPDVKSKILTKYKEKGIVSIADEDFDLIDAAAKGFSEYLNRDISTAESVLDTWMSSDKINAKSIVADGLFRPDAYNRLSNKSRRNLHKQTLEESEDYRKYVENYQKEHPEATDKNIIDSFVKNVIIPETDNQKSKLRLVGDKYIQKYLDDSMLSNLADETFSEEQIRKAFENYVNNELVNNSGKYYDSNGELIRKEAEKLIDDKYYQLATNKKSRSSFLSDYLEKSDYTYHIKTGEGERDFIGFNDYDEAVEYARNNRINLSNIKTSNGLDAYQKTTNYLTATKEENEAKNVQNVLSNVINGYIDEYALAKSLALNPDDEAAVERIRERIRKGELSEKDLVGHTKERYKQIKRAPESIDTYKTIQNLFDAYDTAGLSSELASLIGNDANLMATYLMSDLNSEEDMDKFREEVKRAEAGNQRSTTQAERMRSWISVLTSGGEKAVTTFRKSKSTKEMYEAFKSFFGDNADDMLDLMSAGTFANTDLEALANSILSEKGIAAGTGLKQFTGVETAKLAQTVLDIGDWTKAQETSNERGWTTDEWAALENKYPDLKRYLQMTQEQRESEEGKNLKRNLDIQISIAGLSDLEEAGKILEGTTNYIQQLKKDGLVKIKAQIEFETKFQEMSQRGAMLNSSNVNEVIQALLGYGISQQTIETDFTGAQEQGKAQRQEEIKQQRESIRQALIEGRTSEAESLAASGGFSILPSEEALKNINTKYSTNYQYDDKTGELYYIDSTNKKKKATNISVLNDFYNALISHNGDGNVYYTDQFLGKDLNFTATEIADMQLRMLEEDFDRQAETEKNPELTRAAEAQAGEKLSNYRNLIARGVTGDALDIAREEAKAEVENIKEINAFSTDLINELSRSSDAVIRANASNIASAASTAKYGTNVQQNEFISSQVQQARSYKNAMFALDLGNTEEARSIIGSYIGMEDNDLKELLDTEGGKDAVKNKIQDKIKETQTIFIGAINALLPDEKKISVDLSNTEATEKAIEEALNNLDPLIADLFRSILSLISKVNVSVYESISDINKKETDETAKRQSVYQAVGNLFAPKEGEEGKTFADRAREFSSSRGTDAKYLSSALRFMIESAGAGSTLFSEDLIKGVYLDELYGRQMSNASQMSILNSLFGNNLTASNMMSTYENWLSNAADYGTQLNVFKALPKSSELTDILNNKNLTPEQRQEKLLDFFAGMSTSAGTGLRQYTNVETAGFAKRALAAGDWNAVQQMFNEDELSALKSQYPEVEKYLKLTDKQSQEGRNILRDVNIKISVAGINELEEAGELLQGTSNLVEQLKKGGRFEIEAIMSIRSETYEAGQLAAMLTSGTEQEQRQAIMQLTNATEAQVIAEPDVWKAEAEKENARRMNEIAKARTLERKEVTDKEAFDKTQRAAGFELVPDVPNGYGIDTNGNIVNLSTGSIDSKLTHDYKTGKLGQRYTYVGGQGVDYVSAVDKATRSYTSAELVSGARSILNGETLDKDYAEAVYQNDSMLVEYLRRQKENLTDEEYKTKYGVSRADYLNQVNQSLVEAEHKAYQEEIQKQYAGFSYGDEIASNAATIKYGTARERSALTYSNEQAIEAAKNAQYYLENWDETSAEVIGKYIGKEAKDVKKEDAESIQEEINDVVKEEIIKQAAAYGVKLEGLTGTESIAEIKQKLQESLVNLQGEAKAYVENIIANIGETSITGEQAETGVIAQARTSYEGQLANDKLLRDLVGSVSVGSSIGSLYGEGRLFKNQAALESFIESNPNLRPVFGRAASEGFTQPVIDMLTAATTEAGLRYDQTASNQYDVFKGFINEAGGLNIDAFTEKFNSDEVFRNWASSLSGLKEAMSDVNGTVNGTGEAFDRLANEALISAIESTNAFGDSTSEIIALMREENGTITQQNQLIVKNRKAYTESSNVNYLRDQFKNKKAGQEVVSFLTGRGFSEKDVKEAVAQNTDDAKNLFNEMLAEFDRAQEEYNEQLSEHFNAKMAGGLEELNAKIAGRSDLFIEGPGVTINGGEVTFDAQEFLNRFNDVLNEIQRQQIQDAIAKKLTITAVTEQQGEDTIISSFKVNNTNARSSGGGGGGGKSAADKLIEDQKYKVSELEHQQKMLEIAEKGLDFRNDYSGWNTNLDDQIVVQEKLRAQYTTNIKEMDDMLKHVEEGSEDWKKLKEAIMSAEEALASINNTINEINEKRISILSQEQENADKPLAHTLSMQQKYAARYQKSDQFEGYVAMTEAAIETTRKQIEQNNSQIKDWEDLLLEYEEGKDSWITTRDNIWKLKEENADLENQVASNMIDLQDAKIAQIAKDLQNAQSPYEHAVNMLDIYGGMYQSMNNQAGYRSTIQDSITNNQQLKALNDAAIEELKQKIEGMTESDPSRQNAIETLNRLEETSAKYEASDLSYQQAIEESLIGEVRKTYSDKSSILEHEMKLLTEAEKEYLRNDDFVNYENNLKEKSRNVAEQLENQKAALEDYLALQNSGKITEGSPQWEELENDIRSAEVAISELSNSYQEAVGAVERARFENIQKEYQKTTDQTDHELNLIRSAQTSYQTSGELTNYGTSLKWENEVLTNKQIDNEKQLETLRELQLLHKNYPELYDDETKAIRKLEEEQSKLTAELEKNEKAQKKNQEAIRKARTTIENIVDKEIRARIQKERDMLAATVSVENTILEVIRKNKTEEWNLIKKDIDKKKQALNEEKNLISERLNAKKNALNQENKAEELAELQRQLILISADTTRTKEANELREKIRELQQELAWDVADQEAAAAQEAIDNQINALDNYVASYEEDLNEMLSDANNFSDDLNDIMGGTFKNFLDWMKENNESYKLATDDARATMEQSWEDTWKKMIDEVDTYWNEVDETMRSKEGFLAYMQNSDTYRDASPTGRDSLYSYWEEAYDDYVASIATGAEFNDTHEILNKVDELKDWEFSVRDVGLEDYLASAFSDYVYKRNTEFDPYKDDEDYSGRGKQPESESELPAPTPAHSGDGKKAPTASGEKYYVDNLITAERIEFSSKQEAMKYAEKLVGGAVVYDNDKIYYDSGRDIDLYGNTKKYHISGYSETFDTREAAQARLDALKKAAPSVWNDATIDYYKHGGLVDYTGLAWVDGSKTRPESFLDAYDTESLRKMMDAFNYVRRTPTMTNVDTSSYGNTTNIGDINVTINQAELKNDADYEEVAKRVGEVFTKEIQKGGFNIARYSM